MVRSAFSSVALHLALYMFPRIAYETSPCRYTSKKSSDGVDVYAIVLKWADNATVTLGAPKPSDNTEITLLGAKYPLKWKVVDGKTHVQLPKLQEIPSPENLSNLEILVLKLTQLTNKHRPKQIMALPEKFRRNSKIREVR